ncbi:ABC transporter ATP-binding protein [Patescibacteria group bacterium]|nr:ABC transporter ATP-binding protein [Patescibacteria group bacterium]MBP9710522.1 ABC transporter ATP-binding protein [Patescibacteria group bacterium]
MDSPRQAQQPVAKKPSVFGLLRPYASFVGLLILFALLSNGLNLVLPKLVANGMDAYVNQTLILKTVVEQFFFISIGIFVFTSLQFLIQTYVAERVARDLREKISDTISVQGYTSIHTAQPGKLLTNLTADVDSIKLFVSQAVSSIVSSLCIIVGASILLLTINFWLALAVLSILPFIGGTFFVVFGKVRKLFVSSREVIDWLNKVINESILGASLIRVLHATEEEGQKFLAANTKARDLGYRILGLFAGMIPIITFLANIAMLIILVLGGRFVVLGSMSLGSFAAFTTYIALLIFPILIIGFMSNLIAQASASYERISQVLNLPPVAQAGTMEASLQGNVTVKDVRLAYGEKTVLKDISFEIRPGQRVAIIGPTAAGKTQLLYLLTGLLPPTSGTILYDQHPIGAYTSEAFYRRLGLVFQDSILFNLSLRENIAFSPLATNESLQRAIDTAELHDLVQSLPQGLDTIVSERGASLSGGQKQRLMLARALAINPTVLFLDDFTARVDAPTEQKIIANLQKNYPDLTLISVTQKISSVEDYDQIIFLMEGEVLAKGTHQELLATSPEYVQVYNSQRSTSHYELHPQE